MTGGPASGAVADPTGLRSGQVAAAAGVNIETLRYYERRGLLAEPHRSPGGHRLYPDAAVTTLRVIKAAQRLGFTLEEVADLLDVGRRSHTHGRPRRSGGGGDVGLQRRARAKLAEVEERIADLATLRDTLQAALDAGCDDPHRLRRHRLLPHPVRHHHHPTRRRRAHRQE